MDISYSFTHLSLLDNEELLMEVEAYLCLRTNIEEHFYADRFVLLQLKMNYIGNSRGQFLEKGEYSVLDKPLYIGLAMMKRSSVDVRSRLMTMSPLYACGIPCSRGNHKETVKSLALS